MSGNVNKECLPVIALHRDQCEASRFFLPRMNTSRTIYYTHASSKVARQSCRATSHEPHGDFLYLPGFPNFGGKASFLHHANSFRLGIQLRLYTDMRRYDFHHASVVIELQKNANGYMLLRMQVSTLRSAQRAHTDCSRCPRRVRLLQNAAAQDVGSIVGKVVALREDPGRGSCNS